jgi:hypothetical protein
MQMIIGMRKIMMEILILFFVKTDFLNIMEILILFQYALYVLPKGPVFFFIIKLEKLEGCLEINELTFSKYECE